MQCPQNMLQNKSLHVTTELHTRVPATFELMMMTNMCMLQTVKVPQAPPHVPCLDDLHVKEGQRPPTNIDSAARTLLRCLGLRAGPELKAKQQVQLGCRLLITCKTCNATLQLVRIPSMTHIHCQTQLWKSVGSLSGTSQTFFQIFCQMFYSPFALAHHERCPEH